MYNTKHERNINIEWYNLQNPKMHESAPRIGFSFFDGIKTQLDLQKWKNDGVEEASSYQEMFLDQQKRL